MTIKGWQKCQPFCILKGGKIMAKIKMHFKVWKSGSHWMWEVTNLRGVRLAGSGDTSVLKYVNREAALQDARNWILNNNGTIDDYE